MLNSPSAGQLLEAVGDFLRDEALPALSGPLAYKARIAASVLDIVRRELAHAPDAHRLQLQALRALLDDDGDDLETLNRLLCERIASDGMDLQDPGLVAFLWQATLDKLAVDQPGYDTYLAAKAGQDTRQLK